MTNHQKGYRRDRLVLETIEEWGTMDTDQIKILFYPSLAVARRRLRILTNKGRVKRFRDTVEIPYAYYITKYDYKRLILNWARIWLIKHCSQWEVLDSFDYETNTAITRNTVTNAVKTYTVHYNVTRKTWLNDNVIIVYDNDDLRRTAEKLIKGTLLIIESIKEGLKCVKCS